MLTFPATSEVGDTVCQQYTIIGDHVKEADETFTISVTAVNSVDIITNQEVISVTITDDGDGEEHYSYNYSNYVLISFVYNYTVIQDCGPLTDPENGAVNYISTLNGSEANYACNNGYTLSGEASRTCELSPTTIPGVWSGIAPSCACKYGIKKKPLSCR